ncbi:MAG: hypothetical protein KKE62_14855 [Proteobacteria bacterium]|nr:hypothetical protein [Pseudomonadota bacterium]MBU1389290.1 hypothetical protein [Pseudomonadota bacterium]MBU1544110.1 hypothetical protein [Pseudomonadota bacterium]MBU2429738.1 hypothetical protein [Pseudomonadota bacterium]MBU2481630.1 hypothetical protein [Pseudomonadota bacterium]
MKKLLIAGGIIVVLIVVLIVLTLSNLGPIVKETVNTVGPRITKTNVKLGDVSLSIFSGEAKIKDFVLGNPNGFKSAQAMSVGSVYVDIDETSITQNPIVINKIEIVAPQITYEKISGTDNFQSLLKNIQSSAKAEKKTADSPAATDNTQSRKIVINEVIIKDGKVNLTMAALAGKTVTAPLPDLHLKDIGREKQGATPAEAFEQIFSTLYSKISSDSVTAVLNDQLKQLGNLKELGASGLKTGTDAAQKAMDSAREGVDLKSATEGIKGLFGKE